MAIQTFPTLVGLGYPQTRTPLWKTIIQEAESGKDYRVQVQTYPRYRYEIPLKYLGAGANAQHTTDFQTMMGFFNLGAGAAIPFHWNDPEDNSVTLQQIGTGDGSTTDFFFVRALGGFTDPIQDVTAVSQVTDNGTPTVAYTLLTDPNFGLTYALRFNSPPTNGHTVRASFTYNWPCCFDKDDAQFSTFARNFWDLKQIAFTTKKIV